MNQIIFGTAYEAFRRQYVRHLADYPIKYNKLKFNGIKDLLKSRELLRVEVDNNLKVLYYDKDNLMNALSSDMLKFRLKSLIHHNDYERINSAENISPNWDIVTWYYSAFSYASFLLRLLHRGTIFLDVETKKIVEQIISNKYGQIIALDS